MFGKEENKYFVRMIDPEDSVRVIGHHSKLQTRSSEHILNDDSDPPSWRVNDRSTSNNAGSCSVAFIESVESHRIFVLDT